MGLLHGCWMLLLIVFMALVRVASAVNSWLLSPA